MHSRRRILSLFVLLMLALIAPVASQAFILIEIPVVIVKTWSYPVHVLTRTPLLVNAKRLERYGEAVLIYRDPTTYRVGFDGTFTGVSAWNFSAALDFVMSDYSMGTNPATFSRLVTDDVTFTQDPLFQSFDYNTSIHVACDVFDYASNVTGSFRSRTTTMEVLHNTMDLLNVLVWDQTSRHMGKIADPVGNCLTGGAGIHSFESDITAATGQARADLTAIAEDRSAMNGAFYAFDNVSGHLVRGFQNSRFYTVALSKQSIQAVTGGATVDLSGALTTDPYGNVYAWDRTTGTLLYWRASDHVLFKVYSRLGLQKYSGSPLPVDIKDMDFIVRQGAGSPMPANALMLLDSANGAVLAIFRP